MSKIENSGIQIVAPLVSQAILAACLVDLVLYAEHSITQFQTLFWFHALALHALIFFHLQLKLRFASEAHIIYWKISTSIVQLIVSIETNPLLWFDLGNAEWVHYLLSANYFVMFLQVLHSVRSEGRGNWGDWAMLLVLGVLLQFGCFALAAPSVSSSCGIRNIACLVALISIPALTRAVHIFYLVRDPDVVEVTPWLVNGLHIVVSTLGLCVLFILSSAIQCPPFTAS